MKSTKRSIAVALSVVLPLSTAACAPDLLDPPAIAPLDGPVELITEGDSVAVGGTGARALTSLSAHPEGGVVLAGHFEGSITLGKTNEIISGGSTDPFVARVGPDGAATLAWHVTASDPQAALGVAVAKDGTVLVAGEMSGAMNVAGKMLESVNGRDAFLVELSANGDAVEARQFGGTGYQIATSIMPGKTGDVVIAGAFSGKIALENQSPESVGGYDVFVTTLDPTGKARWSVMLGGESDQRTAGMVADERGDACVVGDFEGSMTVSGFPNSFDSNGQRRVFIARLGPAGNVPWVLAPVCTGAAEVAGVAMDGEGNAIVAGSFAGTLELGNGQITTQAESGVFILKIDPAGDVLWARAFGETGLTKARGVALGAGGCVAAVADFTGRVEIGDRSFESKGKEDLLVIQLDASGKALRAGRFGDEASQRATGVTVEKSGRVTVIGQFEGAIDLGGTSVTSMENGDPLVLRLQ
ncbi:hypothetical protein KEG38_32035 [Polyangium jinanense]|uniref:hypothetical protein n=1 Tax=Polyangium jinanense TaxID=2829994 RepID=UPI002340CCCA|nr:hypothetical protein [Polyangium jinanense]MDC3958530.1 hypothetical protein [Polyangium jinanense]